MRDRGLMYSALVLFLALLAFPVWHNLSANVTAKGPDVRLPAAEKKCVAPVEYMRTSHMNLLIEWRDQVVREDAVSFTSGGKAYKMSLTPTCLEQCHGSKADFCDRCHNYAAVAPSCWNCHEDGKPKLPTSAGMSPGAAGTSAPAADARSGR